MNSELEIKDKKLSWLVQKYYVDILLVRTVDYHEEPQIGQPVFRPIFEPCSFFFFGYLGWGETESTCYVGH
jgi:hypothetical protein